MKIGKYWREIVIAVLILLLIIPFWMNNTKAPCPVITVTRTKTDTCWETIHNKPLEVLIYRHKHDTTLVYADVVRYDTVFSEVLATQKVYIDTVNIGKSKLAYAHLVSGTLDSSIYSITVMTDTVYKTVETFKTVYREPFLEFMATAKTAGNNFVPGIAVKRKAWLIGYGFDLVNGRHEINAAYRFSQIK